MAHTLKTLLPPIVKRQIKRVIYGGGQHYCPICGSHLRTFLPAGLVTRRPNARCPVCASLERHRMAWLFMKQRTTLLNGHPKKMLHFAPETGLAHRLGRVPQLDYMTADLLSLTVDIQVDITSMQFEDETFEAVLCIHVLEHILDDIKAIQEIYRVLIKGGWAVIMVPINRDVTYEDPTITDPQARLRVFGQEDHVRIYGRDFLERLQTVPFAVEQVGPAQLAANINYFGLKDDILYYCHKPLV